jgi:xanthine dehydrogenase YagS FAD-binding subunit
MRPFTFQRVDDAKAAIRAASPRSQYLAGGTTLLDLMKLDVMRPERVIDIGGLAAAHGTIEVHPHGIHLGALARMAEAAAHPTVVRDYPVIAQSLEQAASAQLRNMATLGGNVLQRTRCSYFRDTSWSACNKRTPGSGCAAIEGVNRKHAVLGTSDDCIATYPGDFAQALVALDASVDIVGPRGARAIRFEELHRLPGNTPHVETGLGPDDLITGFTVPSGGWTRRSVYLKIRDRQSYEFALASAAVALELQDDVVRTARIALGGVATKPWRSYEAEAALVGKPATEATAEVAAQAAFAKARTRGENAFKAELGQRTLVRAILQASTMSILP